MTYKFLIHAILSSAAAADNFLLPICSTFNKEFEELVVFEVSGVDEDPENGELFTVRSGISMHNVHFSPIVKVIDSVLRAEVDMKL